MTREQLERKAALWDAIRRLWETGGVRLNPGSEGAEALVFFHCRPLEPRSFQASTPERAIDAAVRGVCGHAPTLACDTEEEGGLER
jgi:hypothetical protein